METVDNLINGSIDIHIHAGPDIFPHSVDAVEAAEQAFLVGMKAIVLKNHYYDTSPLAYIVNKYVRGIRIVGGLCLNNEAGGLNSHAVEASCKFGARVLWMPTLSAMNSRARMKKLFGLELEGDGFSILDSKGNLCAEVKKILAIASKNDMVVATGHIGPAEIFPLVEYARMTGTKRLLVTHANSISLMDNTLSLDQQKSLAEKEVFIEYTGVNLLSGSDGNSLTKLVKAIKAIGASHCILSTDMGPATTPPPVEGMRLFISILLQAGISPEEIRIMVKENPELLLGI